MCLQAARSLSTAAPARLQLQTLLCKAGTWTPRCLLHSDNHTLRVNWQQRQSKDTNHRANLPSGPQASYRLENNLTRSNLVASHLKPSIKLNVRGVKNRRARGMEIRHCIRSKTQMPAEEGAGATKECSASWFVLQTRLREQPSLSRSLTSRAFVG